MENHLTTGTFMTQRSRFCLLAALVNNSLVRETPGVVSVKFWNFSVVLARRLRAPFFLRHYPHHDFAFPPPCQHPVPQSKYVLEFWLLSPVKCYVCCHPAVVLPVCWIGGAASQQAGQLCCRQPASGACPFYVLIWHTAHRGHLTPVGILGVLEPSGPMLQSPCWQWIIRVTWCGWPVHEGF